MPYFLEGQSLDVNIGRARVLQVLQVLSWEQAGGGGREGPFHG